ncbi:MAG: hypothetical protein PWQ37_172 [Candidatus Petromonas sp.]|jgi:hypothetical protein|nr:hypothetical protein [Candidatus Petromonas sp.]
MLRFSSHRRLSQHKGIKLGGEKDEFIKGS